MRRKPATGLSLIPWLKANDSCIPIIVLSLSTTLKADLYLILGPSLPTSQPEGGPKLLGEEPSIRIVLEEKEFASKKRHLYPWFTLSLLVSESWGKINQWICLKENSRQIFFFTLFYISWLSMTQRYILKFRIIGNKMEVPMFRVQKPSEHR